MVVQPGNDDDDYGGKRRHQKEDGELFFDRAMQQASEHVASGYVRRRMTGFVMRAD
jgi:hypothetical protein